MNKWDKIPNEILDLILNALEYYENKNVIRSTANDNNNVEEGGNTIIEENNNMNEDNNYSITIESVYYTSSTEWMLVNKQWYHIYLSKKYQHITTNLKDKTFQNIVNSIIPPGIYVEAITFEDMTIPTNYMDQCPSLHDPLINLINKCPKVTKVDFSIYNTNNYLNWTYLAAALHYTRIWKLRSIPNGSIDLCCPNQYFECATIICKTLQSLTLTKGMMIYESYSKLTKFNSLITLHLHETIQNIMHFYNLLKYTPKSLKDIEVTFRNIDTTTPKDNNDSLKNLNLSNIRSVKLINYTPKTDQEIKIFIKVFTKLESLIIHGCKKEPLWPSKNVSQATARSFLGFIHTVPYHFIEVYKIVNEDDFINQYYAVKQPITLSCLSISITKKSNYLDGDYYKVKVSIEKNQNSCSSTVSVNYFPEVMAEEMVTRAINLLIQAEDIFDEIKLTSNNEFAEKINHLVRNLLSTPRSNLQTLKFYQGCIFKFPTALSVRLLSLTQLHFESLILDEALLIDLSDGLPNLKYLEFISCNFRNGTGIYNAINISLPNSYLKSITISTLKTIDNGNDDNSINDDNTTNDGNSDDGNDPASIDITNNILLISIHVSYESDNTQYYMTCAGDTTAIKLTTSMFRKLEDSFTDDDEVSFIKINAKSVQAFKFFSSNYNITIA